MFGMLRVEQTLRYWLTGYLMLTDMSLLYKIQKWILVSSYTKTTRDRNIQPSLTMPMEPNAPSVMAFTNSSIITT